MAEQPPAADLACSVCGTSIERDQLVHGQAVRMGGEPVCPMCIDSLPPDTKIRIEQMRAMRGLDATTYRFRLPRHPEVQAYTFSTSAALMRHRRMRNRGETLEAPLIAPRSAKPASAPAATAAKPKSAARGAWLLAAGAAAAALLLGIILLGGGEDAVAPPPSDEERAGGVPDPSTATRSDYPDDPRGAFAVASTELPTDNVVLMRIAEEVIADRTAELDTARMALARGDTAVASALLEERLVPSHPLLSPAQDQEYALREAITEAIAASRQPTIAAPEEPAPAVEPAVPASEQPEAPAIADAPEPTEPEPAPPPEPPTATTPPQTLFRSPAAALLGENGEVAPDGWEAGPDGDLVLASRSGYVDGYADLPPGTYRWWLRLDAGTPAGRLVVHLGSEIVEVDPSRADADGWIALGEAMRVSGQQPLRVSLVAAGGAWRVAELAAVDGEERAAPRAAGETLAWTEPPAPPAEPGTVIPLRFSGDVRTLDAFDPSHRVPDGLPGNVDRLVYASTSERRRQQLTLDLGDQDLSAGGIALLVHSSPHPLRTQIDVVLTDTGGREARIEGMPLVHGDWATLIVNPRQARGHGFDPEHVAALTLVDTERAITLPFYLAKAALSHDRPAAPAILRLEERALQPVDAEALARIVATATRIRDADGRWTRDFDPSSYRILVGHHLFTANWRRDLYAEIEERSGQRPPAGTASVLVMENDWLEDAFVMPPDLADQRSRITVIATGGMEFQVGLDRRQALRNFWQALLTTAIESGIVPVVVLGPTKADPEHLDDVQKLWVALDELIADELPGVPVIDLRSVGVADAERFGPGQARRSAELLGEAIVELQERLRAMQAAAQR